MCSKLISLISFYDNSALDFASESTPSFDEFLWDSATTLYIDEVFYKGDWHPSIVYSMAGLVERGEL
jgi:hypothetical protein